MSPARGGPQRRSSLGRIVTADGPPAPPIGRNGKGIENVDRRVPAFVDDAFCLHPATLPETQLAWAGQRIEPIEVARAVGAAGKVGPNLVCVIPETRIVLVARMTAGVLHGRREGLAALRIQVKITSCSLDLYP
jgi:hypothetical protein